MSQGAQEKVIRQKLRECDKAWLLSTAATRFWLINCGEHATLTSGTVCPLMVDVAGLHCPLKFFVTLKLFQR